MRFYHTNCSTKEKIVVFPSMRLRCSHNLVCLCTWLKCDFIWLLWLIYSLMNIIYIFFPKFFFTWLRFLLLFHSSNLFNLCVDTDVVPLLRCTNVTLRRRNMFETRLVSFCNENTKNQQKSAKNEIVQKFQVIILTEHGISMVFF